MNIRVFVLLHSLLVFSCQTDDADRRFLDAPTADVIARLRQQPLKAQYRIFRFGNDKIHPPLMELANPIAERGAQAVPFLIDRLNSETEDIAVKDILVILSAMNRLKTYDVNSDRVLMHKVTAKVSQMRDKEWQANCIVALERIKKSK